MKKIVLVILLGGSLLLVGYESSNSFSQDKTQNEIKTKIATVGEIITVSNSDTLKQSDDSEIIIRDIIDKDTKEIEVLKGSVTLVKGNFSAE